MPAPLKYPKPTIRSALNEIRKGATVKEVSVDRQIPYGTLMSWVTRYSGGGVQALRAMKNVPSLSD